MPAFLAFIPRNVWLGVGAAAAALALALWLINHGAERQRADDAAANARAITQEVETRSNVESAVDSLPDPAGSLLKRWGR